MAYGTNRADGFSGLIADAEPREVKSISDAQPEEKIDMFATMAMNNFSIDRRPSFVESVIAAQPALADGLRAEVAAREARERIGQGVRSRVNEFAA